MSNTTHTDAMSNANTDKKYELTDEAVIFEGRTLRRIRALKTFKTAHGTVKAGDRGGFIEKESNLSHEGSCWVFDDAKVFDNARVYGNASVYGNARVSGDAYVFGNAEVYGDAQVYGNARVSGNAEVYGDARVSGDARVYGCAHVYGNAYVFEHACVYGNAYVYGDALVYGDARVYGCARVHGNTRVYGDACVHGDARVHGYARVSGNADISTPNHIFQAIGVGTENGVLTAYRTKDGPIEVTRGCFRGSIEEFVKASIETHSADMQQEYALLLSYVARRLK